jgi:hypothetical protein
MSTNFYHEKHSQPNKSEEEVINARTSCSVKAIEINYNKNELLVGDKLGNLYVFDCDDFRLAKKMNISHHGIEDLNISPKGSVLGLVLTTGESILCDCSKSYQKILVLENPYEDHTLKAAGVFKSIKLIQDELERSNLFESLTDNRSVVAGNKSGVTPKINYQKYYIKTENAFKAITVHGSNTLRLQQIYRDELTISASCKIVYNIDGKCTNFQVHPSNDYLLATSNIGMLYIFKIMNGDLRMKINIPSMSRRTLFSARSHHRPLRSLLLHRRPGIRRAHQRLQLLPNAWLQRSLR